jgi:hypothetical protein
MSKLSAIAIAIISIFLLLVSVGHGGAPGSDSARGFTPLQEFLWDPFEPPLGRSMVLGDALEKIVCRFGEPLSTTTRPGYDHTGNTEPTERLLRYDGLVIIVGVSENEAQSWIRSVEISSDDYGLKYGLKIGSSSNDVLDALAPSRFINTAEQLTMSDDVWEMHPGNSEQSSREVLGESYMEVTFDLDGDNKVTNITLESIGY